jgi:beta-D-xylosidase 4
LHRRVQGAAADVWDPHHYGKTPAESAADTIKAGMDVDCGSFLQSNLATALTAGDLTEAQLDVAVAHLFSIRVRLGYFDGAVNPYSTLTPNDIDVPAHQALALRAPREGIVLLENRGLPLSSSILKTVAVIGPNSNDGGTMQGVDCHGVPPYLVTPAMGVGQFASVTHVNGCGISSPNMSEFPAAVQAAATTDATVLVMGLDQSQEYEMRDRTTLLLPPVQTQLIHVVAAAAAAKGAPVVLALMCGGVIDVSEFIDNPNITAILWVGYPGQSGGQALAEIIFGAVAPSGRTPLTWYPNSYLANLSMYDMGLQPNASSTVKQGRTYRYFTGTPLYPFGFGRSYTTFQITEASGDLAAVVSSADIAAAIAEGPKARFTTTALAAVAVHVENVGDTMSSTSVLAYVSAPGAGANGIPIRSLVGFERVSLLAPHETSATLSFPLDAYALSIVSVDGSHVAVKGDWTISFSDAKLQVVITVV